MAGLRNITLLALAAATAHADTSVTKELRAFVDAPPPAVFPSDLTAADPRIRSLFFEGAPYRGKPTRVFAWLGVPKRKEDEKVPGIVLLHGGGGTAFESWVQLWVDRGYAAIAIDHFGNLPLPADADPRPRNPDGGPLGGSKAFSQLGEPLTDQWPYQAVSAAILAHSLLRAESGVDAERTGVTGISWGGYLSCVMAGLDQRLKFAVPVYGCGHYRETTFAAALDKLPADQRALWYDTWDASHYIPGIRAPTLWVNGPNDKYFWLPAWQKSHRQMPAGLSTASLRLGMKHGSPPAGDPPEVMAFAESVVRGSRGLLRIIGTRRDGHSVRVEFDTSAGLSGADLVYTSDTRSPWEKRLWQTVPARITGAEIQAEVPVDALLYYVALRDEHGMTITTDYEELP